MHDLVLTPETKAALEVLAGWAAGRGFYLAGGTGCALHLGHRISQDLDFFTPKTIEPPELQHWRLWHLISGKVNLRAKDIGFPGPSLEGFSDHFFITSLLRITSGDVERIR